LVPSEVGSQAISEARTVVFQQEKSWGEGGSPWQQFYSKAAAMPGKRLIMWNTDRYLLIGYSLALVS
jgi:hypothetical protein